ncbi:hypothetical protein [Pseudomonas aeruginosa]|uniref:hypothetical protein n=1 Tax=Pseudomonas aeruginosa TaxID=287 RepID=UPI002448D3AF|nr:hypothetical protein [Pseudomonas aeruginosa]MDH0300105.1 hypothetical protein [Pseudomonas aeruginosa]
MSKELNKAPAEQAGTNVGHGHVFPRADGVKMRCGGPGLCSECAADASRARAALAQPSPTLPPFAEKVLAKLRRFYDCASDFESGGVDIGRHWLDLLTQLRLLNRVQRSPALWEISQQGEDLLDTPQPSPAQAEVERPEVVGYLSITGARLLREWGVTSIRREEFTPEACEPLMTVAQHERIVKAWIERWKAYIELSAKIAAQRDAANARLHEVATACATAEQERDAALAEVERLRESKGDPSGSFDRCMKMMYERDENAKRLDAALARVAELETALTPFAAVADAYDDSEDDDHEPYTDMGCDDRLRLTLSQHRAARTALSGAPSQAQHSVPEKVRTLLSRAQCEIEHLAECLENVCEDEEDFDVREDVADGRVVAADIAHMLAAAPAQGGDQ